MCASGEASRLVGGVFLSAGLSTGHFGRIRGRPSDPDVGTASGASAYTGRAVAVYADVLRYRELFASLFRRDLQARYRGSLLGVLWTLVNPLVLLGIYLLVFSLLTKFIAVDHPALFLLSGLTVWVFFSTALHTASRSMLDNANLIRKTRFPRQLVPLSVVATHLVTFAVMLGVLLALNLAFLPRVRDTAWLAVPLSVALVGLVGGLALALASANVVFRDVVVKAGVPVLITATRGTQAHAVINGLQIRRK